MNVWLRELAQASRRLTRAPGFSLTVVVVFVVSVGIAASVSSLASVIFRQAVPYDNAERLVNLHERNQAQGNSYMQNSWPTFQVWKEEATIFDELGLVTAPSNLTLTTDEGGERVVGGLVSPSIFRMLGVEMAAGRPFGEDEEGYGVAAPSIVLSHDFWNRQFGGDPRVLGTTLSVNGTAWNVVGVLPPQKPLLPTVAVEVDVWLPVGHASAVYGVDVSQLHTFRVFTTLGLVREGVTRARLDQEVNALSGRLGEMYPETSAGWDWLAPTLLEVVTRQLRGPSLTLLAGALLLLLVAVTNVLGLFGQRARTSAKGAAVRLAVGGSRKDLTRTATAEAGLLVVPGTLLGLAAATVALESYASWTPFPLPPHMDVVLDPRALAAAIGLASVTVVLVGAVTGWWWWKVGDSSSGLGAHRGGSGSTWRVARVGLALQVALAAMLTVTGLVTLQSFSSLADADIGFDPGNLLVARIDVPAELRPREQLSITADQVIERLRALPEVEDAALWSPHVPAEAVWSTRVAVFDRPDLQEPADQPLVRIHQVGHQAASLLGLRFVSGRDFTLDDRVSGRRVAIVSETAAREWWGGEEPLGRLIRRWNHQEWSEVVGIIADAPLSGRQPASGDNRRDVMFLHDQDPQPFMVFLMRTRTEAGALVRQAPETIRQLAPDLPIYYVRYMREIVSRQEQLSRSTAMLGAIFAGAALLLVAVGLYGVLSHIVAQKGTEISLRKALGASTVRIMREVATPAFAVLAFGSLVGLALARVALPRWLGSTLFEVDPTDVRLYLITVGILLLVTVPALVEPAARGSRRDPVDAIRKGVGS